MFRIGKKRFLKKSFPTFPKKLWATKDDFFGKISIFFSLKWLKVQKMGPVPINNMQIPPQPSLPLINGHIGFLIQRDAQCSETYEKTIFLFFIFWEMVELIIEKVVTNSFFLLRFWWKFHSRLFQDSKHFLNFLNSQFEKKMQPCFFHDFVQNFRKISQLFSGKLKISFFLF